MKRIIFVSLFMIICLFDISYAGNEIIGFDTFPDGSPIAAPYALTTEYSSLGVIFSTAVQSENPTIIPNTYWSYSYPNILSSTSSPDPDPDYWTGGGYSRQTPIIATFVDPTNSSISVTTNEVSIVAIMQSASQVLPLGSVALIGYDLYGNVIATATNTIELSYIDDPVSEVLTIQAPGIASVMYDMDIINDGYITSGSLDDFSFNSVTVIPEPLSSALFIVGAGTLGIRNYLRRKDRT